MTLALTRRRWAVFGGYACCRMVTRPVYGTNKKARGINIPHFTGSNRTKTFLLPHNENGQAWLTRGCAALGYRGENLSERFPESFSPKRPDTSQLVPFLIFTLAEPGFMNYPRLGLESLKIWEC